MGGGVVVVVPRSSLESVVVDPDAVEAGSVVKRVVVTNVLAGVVILLSGVCTMW